MKAIIELFKDYGNDCDLDVNNHLLFYDNDDNIIYVDHNGEALIEDYFAGTKTLMNGALIDLSGREAINVVYDGDYSLALEMIIDNYEDQR